MPAISGSFEGLNNIAGYNPPDTVGDVGTNHYMQMTNVKFRYGTSRAPACLDPRTTTLGPECGPNDVVMW